MHTGKSNVDCSEVREHPIRFSYFWDNKKEKALTEIRRNNQSYERLVSLDFLGNYRIGREYIQEILKTVPVPVGAKINFGICWTLSFIWGLLFSTGLILLTSGTWDKGKFLSKRILRKNKI